MSINWKKEKKTLNNNAKSNLNVWIKPISKGKLVAKLIPFIVVSLCCLATILALCICPSFVKMTQNQKIGCYASVPIFIVLFFPICWYLFDKAYVQYNLEHNEKIKNKFAKNFVKNKTDNGCFNLRDIYLMNPNQLAWDLKEDHIVENFKKWNPKEYDETIKYYKEL